MQRLIQASIKYRFLVLTATLLMAVVGVRSMLELPIDAVPDVSPNQVQVITRAAGLGPLEVEQYISFPVETAMSGLPGIERIRSVSRFGLSAVFIYFGDLGPALKACGNVLRAGGTLVFTTEAGEQPGYHLRDTRRYVHHADYVAREVEASGMETVSLDETILRFNRRAPVRSHVRVVTRQ